MHTDAQWLSKSLWSAKSVVGCALLIMLAALRAEVFAQVGPTNAPNYPDICVPGACPKTPEPEGYLSNVKNYDDPLCLQWSNYCDKCTRDPNDLNVVTCEQGPAECERKYVDCLQPNFKLAFKFCRSINSNGNLYAPTISSKAGPNAGRFPSTSLITCDFKNLRGGSRRIPKGTRQ
jgi:hypothetical protein